MKKLFLTLIVTLAFSGTIFAQHPETAYPGFYDPDYADQAALYASIMIDGVAVDVETANWEMLEVVAFVYTDGEEVQRSYGMWLDDQYLIYGELFPTLNADAVYYNEPGEELHFKMHDHATGKDYAATYGIIWDDGTEVTISTGEQHWEGFEDPDHPLMLVFTEVSDYPTFELTVTGYGEDNANTNLGYYLIASPVMELVEPTAANGFLTDDFDLYYFDQGQDKEWVNYEDQYNGGWKLVNGMGYLYASETTTTLQFTGTPQTEPLVQLEWKDWVEFPGLNLIGNPLPEEAYADRNYYRMNTETRNSLVPAGIDEPIGAMEGIFVVATEEGEFVTFSTVPAKLKTELILNLRPSETNTVIDRAIVNFDEGQELPKIEILNRDSKIYFPKENQDYAMINAGGMGEIPFCFKAVKNGNFTLSFTSKEVTFTYLHLIDNMTGANVDLLKTPSYSFDALTTDYANRFSLVLSTGSSVDGDSFSFVNAGGNLCIFGIEGEATLQVVDVLGHMISSETFSGSIEKKLNVAPGVYMLRLIQGNDVKVQKTVIK